MRRNEIKVMAQDSKIHVANHRPLLSGMDFSCALIHQPSSGWELFLFIAFIADLKFVFDDSFAECYQSPESTYLIAIHHN